MKKVVKISKDQKITRYKLFGVSVLKRIQTPHVKKVKLFGIKIHKRYLENEQVFIEEKQQQSFIEKTIINLPSAKLLKTHRIAFIIEASIPQCKLYRVTNKIDALKKLGYDIDVVSWQDRLETFKILQTAELVIFYRVPFVDCVQEYYKEADRLGIKKIFDIDDLIFDENLYAEYLKGQKLPEKVKQDCINGAHLYLASLENADAVWVSTETLAKETQKYNPNVKVVPNCVPSGLYDIVSYKAKDKVKIFYGSGTTTHDSDFLNCMNALEEVLIKYNAVELYIHGFLDISIFPETVQNKIHKIDFVDADDYYFSTSGYDIALAPLDHCVFSDAKSNIKFIEAGMLEIPIIASNAKEFTKVIKNGVNGFIAETKEDWVQALEFLIENNDLRKAMGKKAKETIWQLYGQEANCNYIKNAIGTPIQNQNVNKKRILFVNILYGYSSFGGATIVAEQLAEKFNAYENWESFVFTCHIDDVENILVRYDWKGVPVFSSSIHGVSLKYRNEQIISNFEKVLKIVNPDIVHFHCIQTIGIDVMNIVHKHHIPFTLTMHDCWFACANQFMLDKNRQFCDQKYIQAEVCLKKCELSNKEFFKRKHQIYEAIKNADYICSPTKVFNKQIEQNFPGLRLNVNSNGIDFQPQKVNKNKKEKIVFGFFGGREAVKGYFFMQNILLNYPDSNWEIVLIDTVRKFGLTHIVESDWNGKAFIHGYVSHKEMDKIYQSIDVLLFPSEWNESFGLMIREAIANDVFVISSDCGGPTNAIRHGENGLIFHKKNEQEFIKCLDYVFEHKEQIKNYHTTNYGDIRSFDDQALELKEKFESILKRYE